VDELQSAIGDPPFPVRREGLLDENGSLPGLPEGEALVWRERFARSG
jgi:hypothetical protein